MARKQKQDYYELFQTQINHSTQAAEYLQRAIENFDDRIHSAQLSEMHEIEHRADNIHRGLMKQLIQEFVTPIEREDIVEISDMLDDITDEIEDVLQLIYMYHITSMRPEVLEFAELITLSCKELEVAFAEFENHRKSEKLDPALSQVVSIEEAGDDFYVYQVHELFKQSKDPVELMTWSSILKKMESCLDLCKDTAGLLEEVIMKNS